MKERHMLNDTVLVKRNVLTAEKAERGAPGVLIPEISQQKEQRGIVLNIPPNETEIHIGDVVVFSKYSAEDITIDNEEFVRVHRRGLFWIEK